MPTTQRHALMIPFSLLALATIAPACSTTVIGGPLPQDQVDAPESSDPGAPPADGPGGAGKPASTPAPAGWERYDFAVAEPLNSDCHGDRYVTYSQAYGKWVGAILCSAERYKLVMGEAKDELFYELADDAGHGQDHCELVNPAFTIPNEDDITSGCSACDIGLNDPAAGPGVFVRAFFGETFGFTTDVPQWAHQTAPWIECGVSFPFKKPKPGPTGGWEREEFTVLDGIQSDCDGDRYVKYVPEDDVWVGAILCSPTRYKLVMSDARDGLYLELTDYAGHGQDHCELLDPAFTIPNEDDITSGCPSCSIGSNYVANGPKAYNRGYFGEEFSIVSDMPQWGYQTTTFIECGVSIP